MPDYAQLDRLKAKYEALDAAHVRQDYEPFLNMIADLVREGFKPYWHALGISE